MSTLKKVLITGGAGFIGSQLSNLLSSRGFKVFILDKFEYPTRYYLKSAFDIIDSDINDCDKYSKVLNEVDLVIHLAASGNVMQSIKDPVRNFQNNVTGTLALLEALRLSKCNRIFFSSTGGALMGNARPPVSESSLPDPISPYGASKLACEGYIKSFATCFGIEYTIFRFGNVIGPNCSHKSGVIQKFHSAIISDENLDIFGDVSRDFISSGDIVEIIAESIRKRECMNETILLASGIETRIIDLAKIMLAKFPESKSQIIFKGHRLGEVAKNYADISKFRSIYPSFHFASMEESVTTAISFLNGNIE